MSKYLRAGWHEFLIPAKSGCGAKYLRVWIEMEDVVTMLRRLDQRYGDEEHPWALRVEDIPHAQQDLLDMVIDHVISRPEAVRRVAADREFAAELAERFGIRASDYPLPYPAAIDQVDLDIGQAALALPFVVSRPTENAPGDPR
jgi:hypothetical protein